MLNPVRDIMDIPSEELTADEVYQLLDSDPDFAKWLESIEPTEAELDAWADANEPEPEVDEDPTYFDQWTL